MVSLLLFVWNHTDTHTHTQTHTFYREFEILEWKSETLAFRDIQEKEQRSEICSWNSPDGSVVKNPPTSAGDTEYLFDPWVRKIPWRKEWQLTPAFLPGTSSGTENPGRLQSMGLQRVGHNQQTELACTFCCVRSLKYRARYVTTHSMKMSDK